MFAELGIDRLSEDTCLRPHEYERYRRITVSSPEQYLFDEVVSLGAEITERLAQLSRTRDGKAHFQEEARALRAELKRQSAQLSQANSRLSSISQSSWYRLGRLLTSPGHTLKRLSRRSGKRGD